MLTEEAQRELTLALLAFRGPAVSRRARHQGVQGFVVKACGLCLSLLKQCFKSKAVYVRCHTALASCVPYIVFKSSPQ